MDRILIIEDEAVTRATLASYLEAQGYDVVEAESAEVAEASLEGSDFDLLIVDVKLEGKSGLQITREQRAKSSIGIILLTALDDDVDRIVGLEMGADDYVCKPFNRRELLARIRNLLHRTAEARRLSRRVVRFEGFEFERETRRLTNPEGEDVPLTRAEYEVLNLLISKAGGVVTREALMTIVTHRKFGTNPRTVDVLIRRLRGKLEPDPATPKLITTAHGEGYVFTGRLN
ncbi:response regulator [Pacificoceanicola onchidii]|uniref:response regulator n=1 Tax=Pacificoceanicola onchidii TaxID=2562685 RepID=UPI0010A2CD9F|nr:response regulator [Pacificoceanicola onchidii]